MTKQSLQFIVAAAEFKESLATSAIANGKMDFDNFVSTVDKYIKDSSPFEVNIDSKSKRDIMSVANAAAFRELSQVGDWVRQPRGVTNLWLGAGIVS